MPPPRPCDPRPGSSVSSPASSTPGPSWSSLPRSSSSTSSPTAPPSGPSQLWAPGGCWASPPSPSPCGLASRGSICSPSWTRSSPPSERAGEVRVSSTAGVVTTVDRSARGRHSECLAHLDGGQLLAERAGDQRREVPEGELAEATTEDLEEELSLALGLDLAQLVGEGLEDAHGAEHARGPVGPSIWGRRHVRPNPRRGAKATIRRGQEVKERKRVIGLPGVGERAGSFFAVLAARERCVAPGARRACDDDRMGAPQDQHVPSCQNSCSCSYASPAVDRPRAHPDRRARRSVCVSLRAAGLHPAWLRGQPRSA
jgi:hypothetical protein